jgi:hypothetical protein
MKVQTGKYRLHVSCLTIARRLPARMASGLGRIHRISASVKLVPQFQVDSDGSIEYLLHLIIG